MPHGQSQNSLFQFFTSSTKKIQRNLFLFSFPFNKFHLQKLSTKKWKLNKIFCDYLWFSICGFCLILPIRVVHFPLRIFNFTFKSVKNFSFGDTFWRWKFKFYRQKKFFLGPQREILKSHKGRKFCRNKNKLKWDMKMKIIKEGWERSKKIFEGIFKYANQI